MEQGENQFVKMLMALFATRTVNLDRLADGITSDADKESRYRRLQRFFALFRIDFDVIAGFIFKLFFTAGGKWYLTMDRTNWKWGKSDIDILTLAIAYKGIAIPIYWELLDKRGNSDTQERILYGKRSVLGTELYLSALKLPDGEFLIVATNDEPGFAIKKYALRWEIETAIWSSEKQRF